MTQKHSNTTDLLKNLSSQDFLGFGMHDVAYVREVSIEGRVGYAIHAADGTPLSVLEDKDTALAIILHNELERATVH